MADFSELKAAIRADIKDNTEQEITGDVLQGDLLRMVDDINAAKADTATVEDVTEELRHDIAEKLSDAPSDGRIYGRKDGAWIEVNIYSSLSIALTLPSGVSAEDITVVLRYNNGGAIRRNITYSNGFFLDDIPAATEVTVNFIVPTTCYVPAAVKYMSHKNTTQAISGEVGYIVDGVYVYDVFRQSTPSSDWSADNNEDARGIRLRAGGSYDFIVATKFADPVIVYGKSVNNLTTMTWGRWLVNVETEYGIYGATTAALAQSTDFTSNNRAMLTAQDTLQQGWRDEGVMISGGFAAAACCYKYKPCEGDVFGDWLLPDAYYAHIFQQNPSANTLLKKIAGFALNTADGNAMSKCWTCVPDSGNNINAFDVRSGGSDITSSTRYSAIPVLPFKILPL